MTEQGTIWAVVHVWRGFPDGVELFVHEKTARKRELQLRDALPQEDEIGVFEIPIPSRLNPSSA